MPSKTKPTEKKKSFHKKKGWKRLAEREPKVKENPKTAIFMKGRKTTQLLTEAMDDLGFYKKPYLKKFNHKHEIQPFDDETPIEVYSKGQDASLTLFGNSTKKRPNCLTFIRCYDHRVLDMIELKIEEYTPIREFKGEKPPTCPRVLFSFVGSAFETDEQFKMFKNIIVDFYKNDQHDKFNVEEITTVMAFSVVDGKILMSVYHVTVDNNLPVYNEVGPRFVFAPERNYFAANDLREEAMQIPPQLAKPKKKKNVTKDMFGQVIGKVHAQTEDLSQLAKKIRLPKALRQEKKDKKEKKLTRKE
ncbi:brix domain containing protein, putative [Entamoeba invadens IP1]|uniref:Ribosome production factor 2 homolog n=1 Tax=Entamoeba invadens IP1 TaxID=370355 RepID=A0A0A1UFU8_ENTIV|nr:brix domain containing protein, putative [Entamoeba invadens IP1]ELP91934.1 brix domain containing protein, putative [Entamoeba invadens IP1]|eukprot:XP_004258705.1 brix domain containing protein, putative [Entamoeba invadens IP1]